MLENIYLIVDYLLNEAYSYGKICNMLGYFFFSLSIINFIVVNYYQEWRYEKARQAYNSFIGLTFFNGIGLTYCSYSQLRLMSAIMFATSSILSLYLREDARMYKPKRFRKKYRKLKRNRD